MFGFGLQTRHLELPRTAEYINQLYGVVSAFGSTSKQDADIHAHVSAILETANNPFNDTITINAFYLERIFNSISFDKVAESKQLIAMLINSRTIDVDVFLRNLLCRCAQSGTESFFEFLFNCYNAFKGDDSAILNDVIFVGRMFHCVVEGRNWKLLDFMFALHRKNIFNINCQNTSGENALCAFVDSLKPGADVTVLQSPVIASPIQDGSSSKSSSRLTAGDWSSLERLITAGIDVNGGNTANTPLQRAINKDLNCLAHWFIEKGVRLVPLYPISLGPLHHAVMRGNLPMTNEIINRGIDFRHESVQVESYTWLAAREGHLQILNVLIDNGAAINWTSAKKQHNILHVLVTLLSTEDLENVIRRIVEKNRSLLDARDANENTPLHLCAKAHPKNARVLIDLGASLVIVNKRGELPIDIAVNSEQYPLAHEMIEKLDPTIALERPQVTDSEGNSTDSGSDGFEIIRLNNPFDSGGDDRIQITFADFIDKNETITISSEELIGFEALLDSYIRSKPTDKNTEVYRGLKEKLEGNCFSIDITAWDLYHLIKGININQVYANSSKLILKLADLLAGKRSLFLTQLLVECIKQNGSEQSIQFLINHGAYIQVNDQVSFYRSVENPLHVAARAANGRLIQCFLNFTQIDINLLNHHYEHILCVMSSQEGMRLEPVKILYDKGADINGGDSPLSPLIEAYKLKNRQHVSFYLSNGASIKRKVTADYGLIHEVAKKGDINTANQLIEKDPSIVDEPDSKGFTPIYHAAQYSHYQFVKCLMDRGVSLKYESSTLLHCLAQQEQSSGADAIIDEILSNHRELINAKDHAGNTPLHYALIFNPELAEKLILAGAELFHHSAEKKLPVQIALEERNLPLARLILARMMQREQSRQLELTVGGMVAGPQPVNSPYSPFITAAIRGDITSASRLLSQDRSVLDVVDQEGYPAVYHAAKNKNYPFVAFLLDQGASAKYNRTSLLHYFAQSSYDPEAESIIERLIGMKDLVGYRDQVSLTSLRYAAATNIQVAVKLIEHGAKLSSTVVKIAFDAGHKDVGMRWMSLLNVRGNNIEPGDSDSDYESVEED